ncbi:hypothetical protein ABZ611_32320, partial [Streptomyces sp. NPDC007861]|uniref:hypothetical protein n=1 Tax=Streptomyces sp. NPDC007861 TaxID=3154893 RepID=UPI0033C1FADD
VVDVPEDDEQRILPELGAAAAYYLEVTLRSGARPPRPAITCPSDLAAGGAPLERVGGYLTTPSDA